MIEYREFGPERTEEAAVIYRDRDWQSYLGDSEKLSRAFANSAYLLGAFDGDRLVGFARCVSDGEYISYVQDLIVHSAYQRRGIGRALMERVSARYEGVRQFALITDKDDEDSNAFYRAIGMVSECNGFPVNHYFRKALK